ncbi:zinc finger protein Xfin-like [Armigeres subalbatus]|uniref:zinc finger protein Xfin-like n=1 Tax=Armigeres subalbatus TaxID=124917 RepID=UPI002ED69730
MTSREIKEEFTEVESANDNPHTICRLCMSEELLEDVFKENGVCQWISYYLSIMISTDDVLSHVICTICRIRLVEFHQFRLRCQEVQTVLKAKLPKEAAKGLKARRDKPSIASTQCFICKKQFNDKKALWNHRRMHKPKKHMCTSCDKSFALRSALIRHMQTHENERFRKQMEIWNSLANTANESDPLRCKICQIKFLTEQKYIIHQKHVHGPNRHVCDVCNFKCSMKCDLYSHFRTTAHLRKIGKLPSTDTQVTTPDMNIRSIGSTRVQEIQEMCEDSDLRSIIGRPHSQNGDDDQSAVEETSFSS